MGTPTMGGIFFIPIGIAVAKSLSGQSSVQLYGAAAATIAFAAIGLLDDLLSCMKSHNYGLSGWVKLILQVIGKALVLDEIINYVQSLHNQVEVN